MKKTQIFLWGKFFYCIHSVQLVPMPPLQWMKVPRGEFEMLLVWMSSLISKKSQQIVVIVVKTLKTYISIWLSASDRSNSYWYVTISTGRVLPN